MQVNVKPAQVGNIEKIVTCQIWSNQISIVGKRKDSFLKDAWLYLPKYVVVASFYYIFVYQNLERSHKV